MPAKPRNRMLFLRLVLGSGMMWLGLAVALAVAVFVAPRYFADLTTLKVAVVEGSDDARLIAGLAKLLPHAASRLNFQIVPVADPGAAAAAMEEGRADLAVVRADVALPSNGATILTLHQDLALIVGHSARIKTIADLAHKRIGILQDRPENRLLLEAILAQAALKPGDFEMVPLQIKDIAGAFERKQVDAVFSLAPLGGSSNDALVAAVSLGTKAGAVIVDVPGAEGIAKHRPMFHALEIPASYFGAAPQLPAEDMDVLGVDYLLQARVTLDETIVASLTRPLFVIRPQVAVALPLASGMAKPEDEKTSARPLHVGAAAYYADNEKSFLDRYADWIYLGAMFTGVLGLPFTFLAGLRRAGVKQAAQGVIDDLIAARENACAALPGVDLVALEARVDALLTLGLQHARKGHYDEATLPILRLAMDEARAAVLDLRGRAGAAERGNVTLLRVPV